MSVSPVTTAVVDNDIITLSKRFLAENAHFVVKLGVVEARAVSNWLQTQLIREREGWKNQLATSLKEIERQRKLAQSWETRYQDICGQLMLGSEEDDESFDYGAKGEKNCHHKQQQRHSLDGWRAAGRPEHGGTADDGGGDRERLLCALRRRNDQLEERIRRLRSEREECMTMLGAGENKEKEGPLTKIVKKKLKEIEQKFRENRDVVLRKTKKDLTEANDKMDRFSEEICQLKSRLEETRLTRDVKHSLTVLNYGGTNQATVAANLKVEKLKTLLAETRKTMQEAVAERESKIQRLCDQLDTLDREMNSKEDQIARYEKQIQSFKVIATYNPAFRPPIIKSTSRDRGKKQPDATLSTNSAPDTIMTTTANLCATSVDPLYVEAIGSVYSQKFAPQSYSLPSLSVGQPRKPVRFGTSGDEVATQATTAGGGVQHHQQSAAKTGVHRCLRCNKLYRLTDNTRLACRFHSKAKRKREKVDMATGKLMDIVYSWDCCGQPLESPGCCRMAHV